MTATFFPTRFVVRLSALLALAAAGAVLSAAGDPAPPPPSAPDKPPRPPEEEEPNPKPISHPVRSDEPDDPSRKLAPAPRAVDLKEAARNAKNFAVKQLFLDLAVPHDVLKYTEFAPKQRNKSVNIVPVPDYIDDKPDTIVEPFTVTPFPETSWTPDAPIPVDRKNVAHIKPYEKLALERVDEFLKAAPDPKDPLSRYDRDVAAAQALTTVLLRLQSARQTGGRRGAAWDAVEEELKQKLLGVLLDQRDDRVQAGQWDEAFGLTKELAGTYRTPKEQEQIAVPLIAAVRELLAKAMDDKQKAEARRRLRQLADLFADSAVIQPVNDELEKQAQQLLEAAKGEKDKARRDELLNQAREAWPALPGLHTFMIQQGNQHPTLCVGVRELPSRMSPGLASTDSDRRAVELMFESLVKLEPDGAGGGRWEPGLAQGRPTLVARGRQFELPPDVRWSDGQIMTARDVAETVKRIREGRPADRPPVWGALFDKMDNAEVLSNPHRVQLTLRQGWLDPLALMNFKVLPSEADPGSADFAAKPRGSGPYVYRDDIRTDEAGRTCVAFTANPYYAARPGKSGLPQIEEIHFIAYNFKDDDPKSDHAKELAKALEDGPGRLDLLLDLNAREAAALQKKASDLHVKKVTGRAAPNRRIYFLAVNNDKSHLNNAAFRCALAYAIHRDKLLDDDFRASPGQDLHSPLNGPYPVGSWAANPKLVTTVGDKRTLDPFDMAAAKEKMHESGVQDATISLKYPSGDPLVANAMKDLAAQVKEAIGVTLEPTPVSPNELRDAVEKDHNYYLAYYHYDFPDDVYWLDPLLDPTGDPKENFLQYNGPLLSMIKDVGRRRDFPDVQGWAYQVHDTFLKEEMPFIPLWQLDPLAAVHEDLNTQASNPPFDPVLVFPDVERWTLKRK